LIDRHASPSWTLERLQVCSKLHTPHLFRIDQTVAGGTVHCVEMKVKATNKPALAVRCPTCGARVGQKCELATGLPRMNPHFDRRVIAKDLAE